MFCLDLRNHGQSPHSAEMDFNLMAEDVSEFLEKHRLVNVTVLGHSLGGKVAMQLALARPDRLRSLVVVDMSPRAYEPVHQALLHALLALDLKTFHSRAQITSALASAVPDLKARRFLLKNVAGAAGGSFHWKPNLQGIQDNYDRLSKAVHVVPQSRFEKPALFVRGERSNHIGDADCALIQRLFPCAQIETIPDAGHWVHADCPERFVACVRDFLGC